MLYFIIILNLAAMGFNIYIFWKFWYKNRGLALANILLAGMCLSLSIAIYFLYPRTC